jgi:hypothetical protein
VEDLLPDWVEYVFKPVFVELVKRRPRQWWPVVVRDARKGDSELSPPSLTTLIRVEYQQGDWNQCLFKATASALHYCGWQKVASWIQYLPREQAIFALRKSMITHVPEIGGVIAFNQQ